MSNIRHIKQAQVYGCYVCGEYYGCFLCMVVLSRTFMHMIDHWCTSYAYVDAYPCFI